MSAKKLASILTCCLFFVLAGCSIKLGPPPVVLTESQQQPIFRLDKVNETASGVWRRGGIRNDFMEVLKEPAAASLFTKDGSGLAMQIDITSNHIADEPRLFGIGAFSIITMGVIPIDYHSEWPVSSEVTIRTNDGTVLKKYSFYATGTYDIKAFPITWFSLLGGSLRGKADGDTIVRRTAEDMVSQILNAINSDYQHLAGYYRSQPRAFAQRASAERTRVVSTAPEPQISQEKLPAQRQDASALIIGIDYKGRTDIPELGYPSQDAKKIYDVLTDPRYGGIPAEKVTLLLNEKATRNEIVAALRKIKNRDGYTYIYYSGHGAPLIKKEKLSDAFLVPFDAVISDPETMEETSIKLSYLQDVVDHARAKGVLVAIDACFSGSGKSVLPKGGKPLVGMLVNQNLIKPTGTGKVIITSSAPNEQSWEDAEELKSGIFSYYLIEGLKNSKGRSAWITSTALADYVKSNVPKAALRLKNADQNPQIAGSGDFAVVRNWERVRVQDKSIAKSKLKAALEQGFITTDQLNRAVDELSSSSRSKILEGFLAGEIDEKKFGELY